MAAPLFTQNIIACIWDFDKTLIPGYMQEPLFRRYRVDEAVFWAETNALVSRYHERGYRLSGEIGYLNHLLTYVLAGPMAGLNNKILFECGAELGFYPGLPDFFKKSKEWVLDRPEFRKHEIQMEHYIVSTGLAPMIRGSAIAPFVDGIWACEFIENPLQPGFLVQKELAISAESEIAQIGMVIDNTTPAIEVNSNLKAEDRRIPFQNMIYIADGPSDIPSFSVVKGNGGRAYAVYNPERQDEFAQNDLLRQVGRIDHYGPADYSAGSNTTHWLKLHVHAMCTRIAADREQALAQRATRPPRHLNPLPEEEAARRAAAAPKQASFLD
jgi:hypothetical protein